MVHTMGGPCCPLYLRDSPVTRACSFGGPPAHRAAASLQQGDAPRSGRLVSPLCLSVRAVPAPSAVPLGNSLLTAAIVTRMRAGQCGSHVRVVRPAAAFGRDPHDVLRRVLDVAGLAVHAVLRVDLQPLAVVLVLARTRTRPPGSSALRGPRTCARLTCTGTDGSFSVRCAGWSSAWLVLEMNTEDSRSKVSLPSGLG